MRTQKILLAAMALLAAQPLLAGSSGQKERARLITYFEYESSPVVIYRVEHYFRQVQFDTPFLSDDNWLVQLQYSVKNVSAKTINFIQLELTVPPGEADGRSFRHPIAFGENPMIPGKKAGLNMRPGAVGVGLRIWEPSAFLSGLGKIGYTLDDTRAQISLDEVVFDDGSLWKRGHFFTRGNDPSKWLPAPALNGTRHLQPLANERAVELGAVGEMRPVKPHRQSAI
jgi:hypothetical protein